MGRSCNKVWPNASSRPEKQGGGDSGSLVGPGRDESRQTRFAEQSGEACRGGAGRGGWSLGLLGDSPERFE